MNYSVEDDKTIIINTKKKTLFGCLGILLIILIGISYTIYYFFFSMNNLPEGELLKTIESPNETYSLEIYRTDGGATTSFSIRGALVENQTKNSKNIYWNYKAENTSVSWKNEHTVVINGTVLDVRKDKYDWRKE